MVGPMSDKDSPSPFGESLPHLEDLKSQDLLSLFKDSNLSLTEKVDGSFFVIGFDHSKSLNYIATKKGDRYYSAFDIPNIYYLTEIRRVFSLVEHTNLVGALCTVFGLGSRYSDIELVGELVPTHDHNIVVYSQQEINQGLMVVFDCKVDGNSVSKHEISMVCEHLMDLKEFKGLKFSPQEDFKVDRRVLKRFSFYADVLENILLERGEIFNHPARTPSAKSAKSLLKQDIVDLAIKAKLEVLSKVPVSKLGGTDNPEGLVVFSPTLNQSVKLIDKKRFTTIKEQNWFFIDIMKGFSALLRQRLKESPEQLIQHLDEHRRSLTSLRINREQFTLPRKQQETFKHYLMLTNQLVNIEIEVSKPGSTVLEIAQRITEHKL